MVSTCLGVKAGHLKVKNKWKKTRMKRRGDQA